MNAKYVKESFAKSFPLWLIEGNEFLYHQPSETFFLCNKFLKGKISNYVNKEWTEIIK